MAFRADSRDISAADCQAHENPGQLQIRLRNRSHVSCPEYPWIARTFMKSHIEIECDPVVWHRVEDLIRAELPPLAPGAAATAKNASR